MSVRARLVLFGAILPTMFLLVAVAIAGSLFRRDQLAEVDRRLLAQAAVESVGLFDGPNGTPHVHLPYSPLAREVKAFAPESALYDETGALVISVDDRSRVPDRVPSVGALGVVRLGNTTLAGVDLRTLELPVRAPSGKRYTLWLGTSLGPVASTLTRFYRETLTAVGVLTLVLLAIQLVVARRLARRIEVMTSFLPRLRDGDTSLPADPSRDELGALREMLREVSVRLADARAEQDRLLASAAHELRTPLTVLRTECDLALRKQRSTDELREALKAVRDDVDRLGKLAGALLDLQAVRHLGFDRKDGDLGALVREACGHLRTVADAHDVSLRVHVDGPAPARFDERALRQAIDNLLDNALKHAPRGTVIDVTVSRLPVADTARDSAGWQIIVEDRGPGVPLDQAERIFEPFQRAGPGSGTGLGLAIVREVAARHGGRAYVDTREAGQGARFVVEIA